MIAFCLLFVAFVFAQSELIVGSALAMSLKSDADVDICPIKVVIPDSRAGADCVLELRAALTGASGAGGVDLAFYWKKDVSF